MNQEIRLELFEIASAVCDEVASDAQLQRLETILKEYDDAKDIYMNYMLLHADLFWQQPSLVETDHHLNRLPEKHGRPQRGWVSWLTSLAAMLIVGGAIGFVANHFLNDAGTGSGAGFANLDPAIEVELGEEVAKVTHTINCRWSSRQNNGQSLESIGFGSPIYAGQNLDLLEGLAEITFNSGVRMIVEAPANLDLSSVSESVLYQGRLTASVPKGAEGFQVECPGLTLVDRGTEFGVNSLENGDTEVHVFDGLVDGYVNDESGSNFKKVSWKTNDVQLFNSATREFQDVEEPSVFVRSLSQAPAGNRGLYAQEDFDYAVGPLGGLNGGSGWAGPWENISIIDGQLDSNGVGAGSVPFDSIHHIGNHALLSGQFNRIRRQLSTSIAGVFDSANMIEYQDGSRLIGRDGCELYISFTQKISKTNDSFYGFELNRGDGNRNRVLCIGNGAARAWYEGPPRSPNKSAGMTNWAVTSEFNGSNNQLLEIGELGPETTEPVLIVVRIRFGANNVDEVAVFINPDPEDEMNPKVVGKGNFSFDRIGIANFEGDKSFQVDHIRLGMSFSAVINPYRIPISAEAKK